MGKWLGIVVVLGVSTAAAWWFTGPGSQAGQACAKLETLCGEASVPAGACREDLADAPQAELDALDTCIQPANSCLEVSGCLAGSAARELAVGALRGVFGR
ncbi:MAG: hypothetical protein ACRBN8_31890 [Nannocystales bacterium]